MNNSIFSSRLVVPAFVDSFKKMNPKSLAKNPVIFITFIGAVLTTGTLIFGAFSGFNLQIVIWLWFTVLFANFSEAIAEGRGKAQAESLKNAKTTTKARLLRGGQEALILASELRKGDIVVCESGDTIPNDGEIIVPLFC